MKTWLVALLIALLPCVAGAAGMGRLNVLSALGQPLIAEIELSVSREELGSLSARLASPDAYRVANLQYNTSLTGARIAIERRPNGQQILKITSTRPVTEPFIDILVELTWASGRLSREYTALLDPPGVPSAPPAPSISAVPEMRPAPTPEMQPQPKAAPAPAASRPVTAGPMAGGKEYGPIQRGETLGKIAQSVMPEGVTLEQMLVALYRSNPDAFIRKNLNLVRAGKVLRVPDQAEIAAVTRGEAVKEYRTHVADWNSYRQKVAEAAGVAPPAGRTAASGKITTRVEDQGSKGEPKDVVRLSKGEPAGAAGKGKAASPAERIRMLEEEAVAREKALAEASSRISQLEKTIQDMKKLAELKSPGMAAAQQQAAAAKPDPKAAPAKPEAKKPEAVAAAKPEPAKPAEAPKPEEKKPEAVAAAKPEPAKPAEAPKPEAKPAPKPQAEAKPAPKKPAPAPKKKEPELMDQVLEAATDPLYLGVGGGVLALGGLAFFMARRRRSRAGGDDAPIAPTLSKAAAAAAGAAAMTSDTTAASQPAPATADEVDPLAEAEVYIAYGRDGQAEEILKEALSKNPKRADVQLKLLEIYSARKDKAAYGKLAGDFNKLTGGAGDGWLKAAAMGYLLDPGNPLYAAGKDAAAMAAPSAAAGAADVDLDLGLGDTGTATDITLDASAATAGTDTGILDLGVGDKVEGAAATPDFSLDVPVAEPVAAVAAPAESNVIDFQIELPKASDDVPTRASTAPAAAATAGDGGLDFKLDDLSLTLDASPKTEAAGGEKDGHWYDVQTKFDLAKAYQEMGDKDGAKEILQEVMKEGDGEQKAQAKTLLDSLG